MLISAANDANLDHLLPPLRALADPLRLRIVHLLARESLCTCHIVEATGARQTNVSNHLRQLRDAGLVHAEPRGRFTYYRLDTDAVRALGAELTGLADAADQSGDHDIPRTCP
ncbi:ArsR/SmtB family transcription factor [Phytoactinopolyspora limicola]|uniref:ArsR/SmtB family transcription factor n=1 Tax=Phytoactinopolyspora limicola TaxID=2715536 RepID=UPI00140B78B7|nr:metalloregulator ArsR/SmtB family transcription factor [Phytoactinopolyspora limicola]